MKRLVTIDFLRGVAAMAVMLFHAASSGLFPMGGGIASYALPYALWVYPLSFGFAGVYLFFVISGFCIHLRWVKGQLQEPKAITVPFFAFWKRRFRRLYPAYLAALILYITFQYWSGAITIDRFFAWDLISHLLMIHNLDMRTVFSINGIFWTLAIEEQLYLAYFLLLYLRRNFGWNVTFVVTFAARIVWFAVCWALHHSGYELPLSESALSNWWIWALGAYSVEAYFGLVHPRRWTRSLPMFIALLLVTGFLYFESVAHPGGWGFNVLLFVINPLWGVSFFILLNYLVSREGSFSSFAAAIVRGIAWIGLFSYSLYLTHEFVLIFFPPTLSWLGAAVSLPFAWLFYRIFERPFLTTGQRMHQETLPSRAG